MTPDLPPGCTLDDLERAWGEPVEQDDDPYQIDEPEEETPMHRTDSVTLSTRTVGQCFATVGVILDSDGEEIAACERIRPYGHDTSALADAALLAEIGGYHVGALLDVIGVRS